MCGLEESEGAGLWQPESISNGSGGDTVDWDKNLMGTRGSSSSTDIEPQRPSTAPKRRRGKPKKKRKTKSKLPFLVNPLLFSNNTTRRPNRMTDNTAQLGAQALRGHEFCPYAAAAKFPYKYIDRSLMQPVSDNFFANGLFRERGWTLYYIHTYGASPKPLLLVPALEVEAFIHDINKDLGVYLKFPHPTREPGFLLNFDEQGSPRPRYLGRVNAEVSVEDMESKIPGPNFMAAGETEEPEDRSFEAFKAKIEAAIQAGKNKSKSQKERKKKERVVQKQSWCAQLKRAQCYLGVRPRRSAIARNDPINDGTLSWDEFLEAKQAFDLARCVNLPELDISKPVPYSFSRAVVFICVDIEAWEKDHNVITEIGISTLDTNDLMSLPPGEDGKAWMTAIRPRHFRISEYQHLVNSDFVAGCADRFEKDFGASEFISIKEAPHVIASCFKPPFSAAFQMQSHIGPSASAAKPSINHDKSSKRNIILVGHDIKSDINYMRAVGYDVSNLSNVLEAIDTADMYKALKHEQQSGSLGRVLLDLGMTGWNLHNAGNDAAYTLQAMIGIAFAGLRDKQARQAAAAAERANKMENAAQEAQDRIKEEGEEWKMADVEEGDGGVPVAVPKAEVPAPTGFGRNKGATGAPPKMNAAARKAEAAREAKKVQAKEEASLVAMGAKGGAKEWQEGDMIDMDQQGWNYFEGPPKKENTKQAQQNGSVKLVANGAGSGNKVLSLDDLSARMKARLAMLDTDEEGEGGVKV